MLLHSVNGRIYVIKALQQPCKFYEKRAISLQGSSRNVVYVGVDR